MSRSGGDSDRVLLQEFWATMELAHFAAQKKNVTF